MAVVDTTRTGAPSIYHVNCEILIEVTSGHIRRCEYCKKHRKSLCAMGCRNQKDERTDPSSHTPYINLSTPEKNERLSRLHKEMRKVSLQVAQLKEKLSSAATQHGITLSDELHNDVKKMAAASSKQIYSIHSEDSFPRLFWDQQVKASQYSNAKSMKWHPLFIKWCLYLRHLSGKSYDLVRNSGCVKLPSQSTLRDYTHHIPTTIGFSAKVDQHLVDVAFLSKELNKYILLVMDEMHIKHDLVYDKHEGSLIGFVDLGSTNNQLLEFEKALAAKETGPTLASTMLTFMVRGLLCKFNYPYAQFACHDITGNKLFDPMWEAVARLERLGFCVLGVTCDGASPNRRLWRLHSDSDEMVYKVPNLFADCKRDLYFISDPPHLIKTIRNSFCNTNRKLWVRILTICYKYYTAFICIFSWIIQIGGMYYQGG